MYGEVIVEGGGEKWRWADPQGVQRVIHSDELRSALASGALPPYTLVWKRGMTQWLPAYQADELATVAISAQSGLTLNIPPPPLAIIAAQAEFEHRVPSFAEAKKGDSKKEEEPPPPPVHEYAAIAAAVPAHIMRASERAAKAAAARKSARAHAAAPVATTAAAAPAAASPVAPADDELKTLVKAAVPPPVTAVAEGLAAPAIPAPSPKPPAVAVQAKPAAPKPPVKAPPRASGGSPAPPEVIAGPNANLPVWPVPFPNAGTPSRAESAVGVMPLAAEIPSPVEPATLVYDSPNRPPPSSSRHDDASAAPPVESSRGLPPPLPPGALRAAPPPPPRRPPPAAHGNWATGAASPAMPTAPLPLVPPKAIVDMQGHLPAGLHRPSSPPGEHAPGASPPGNGQGALPSSLAAVASSFQQMQSFGTPGAVVSGSSPAPPDLPAFPLEEIEPDDVEDDDGEGTDGRGQGAPIEPLGANIVQRLRGAQQTLGPLAERAKERIGPMAARARDRMGPLPDRARHWFSKKAAPAIENGFAFVKANPKNPKVIVGLSGTALLVIGLLVVLAAATRTKNGVAETQEGKAAESAPSAASATQPAVAVGAVEQRPSRAAAACRMARDAGRLGSKVSKDVPLELAVSASGAQARIGYATDAGVAQGIAIDPATLNVTQEFSAPVKGKLRAVIPITAEGRPSYVMNVDGASDKLRAWRTIIVDTFFVVGWADNAISIAGKPSEEPTAIWPLEGDETPDAIRAVSLGDAGQAIVFRRHGEVFGGMLDKDRKPRGALVDIAGADAPAGAPVGAPVIATNAKSIAVAFADRATSSDPWGVRLGSASLGSLPSHTAPFTVPSGGPGHGAIAPALTGLSDGRWLLVWTEGGGGNHDVRAQTLDAELKAVGSPFNVSHEGGNAGQAAVAVSGGQGLVSYLTLTDEGYELWGAAVDCR